ncbi:von Willebrand factor type A domain protein [compost metagenome]
MLVEKPIERQQPVRDLMLAIDISQSMETTDFTDANGQKINRLAAVKEVVHGFIDKRKDDRIGLIVFGTGAYPQAPLTLDHASLSLLLDDTGIGMAGPNTAIGDAIGLSLKLLDQAREQEKVLILLTDGNDTSSAITPDHAAAMAAAKGVVIHTIGIGDPNAEGEAKVNLQGLQEIAHATGGRFFRAEDRNALDQVYSTLDKLTPHQVKTLSHQPKRDLFWWPLGAAIALLALYHLGALLLPRLMLARQRQEA